MRVFGKATDETLDSDKQIVDLQWAAKAMQKWLATGGNLRVQHNPALYPAGVGVQVDVKSDGVYITGEVIEPTAARLVEKGALRAFSVGIHGAKIVTDPQAPKGRIKDGEIVEVSLVDRPANPACVFSLVKSVDGVATATGEMIKSDNDDDEDDDTDTGHDDDEEDDSDGRDDDGDGDGERSEKTATASSSAGTSSDEASNTSGPSGEGIDRPDQRSEEGETGEVAEKALRLVHDSTCPECDSDMVKSLYPQFAEAGLPTPLSEETRSVLYSAFVKTIESDGGSGQFADVIDYLGRAFAALQGRLELPKENVTEKGADDVLSLIHRAVRKVIPDACTMRDQDVQKAAESAPMQAVVESAEVDSLRETVRKQNKAIKKFTKQVTKLQAENERLGSRPDMTGVASRVQAGAVNKSISVAEAQKSAEDAERMEKVTWLRGLVRTGTPTEASAALDVLTSMGVEI